MTGAGDCGHAGADTGAGAGAGVGVGVGAGADDIGVATETGFTETGATNGLAATAFTEAGLDTLGVGAGEVTDLS